MLLQIITFDEFGKQNFLNCQKHSKKLFYDIKKWETPNLFLNFCHIETSLIAMVMAVTRLVFQNLMLPYEFHACFFCREVIIVQIITACNPITLCRDIRFSYPVLRCFELIF